MTPEEFARRNAALRHAIQTGVAYEMERGVRSAEPKHLRTGIDSQMADYSGLVRLLIDKGVITEGEYFEASVKALEEEVQRYEARLTREFGASIRLG